MASPKPPPPTPERIQTARALVALARLALDECARAGHITDDRPELALALVARWCVGEASRAELWENKQAMTDPDDYAPRPRGRRPKGAVRPPPKHHPAFRLARLAVWTVTDYAVGSSLYRDRRASDSWSLVAQALVLCGEAPRAARARVEQTWERWMGEGAVERSGITWRGEYA